MNDNFSSSVYSYESEQEGWYIKTSRTSCPPEQYGLRNVLWAWFDLLNLFIAASCSVNLMRLGCRTMFTSHLMLCSLLRQISLHSYQTNLCCFLHSADQLSSQSVVRTEQLIIALTLSSNVL